MSDYKAFEEYRFESYETPTRFQRGIFLLFSFAWWLLIGVEVFIAMMFIFDWGNYVRFRREFPPLSAVGLLMVVAIKSLLYFYVLRRGKENSRLLVGLYIFLIMAPLLFIYVLTGFDFVAPALRPAAWFMCFAGTAYVLFGWDKGRIRHM